MPMTRRTGCLRCTPDRDGLSGANLTVVSGADGLGEIATGLMGRRLAIPDSLRGGIGQHPSDDGPDQIGLNASH
jgi:flotillin